MAETPETLPDGVTLTSWDDFPAKREHIFNGVKSAMAAQFPQSMGGVRLELNDLHYVDPEKYTKVQEKEALMSNKFLHRRLRGTYRLVDEKTGDLLDQKEATVMRVPYLTDRGTFLHNGNEITTANQARLRSGVYTRRKASGELESHFNAARGTGSSFRIRMEPESGLMKMDIGQSNLRLYSLLHDLGVPDEELEKRWGKELLQKNKDAYDPRVFDKAYLRLVRRPDPNLPREEKAAAIQAALSGTKLDRGVVSRTLPNLVNVKSAALMQQAPVHQEFGKPDYLLLADFLNARFHAGIPLDLPESELSVRLTEALRSLMPGVNPLLLNSAMDKSAATSKRGCLMAVLSSADAAPIIAWAQEQIPEDKLAGDGIEHESHCTIRYGFRDSLDIPALRKFLREHPPVRFTLGKVTRFAGVFDGKMDALVLEVDSADLTAFNAKVSKKFSRQLDESFFRKYLPHLTLAYVKPGACKSLERNARFAGSTYVVDSLVYSYPDSSRKVVLKLGK